MFELKVWLSNSIILKFLEDNNINILNLIFIIFTLAIVVLGSLINLVEAYLPICIRQSFRYGKHSYKGKNDPFINRLEVSKSWFKHFYVFAVAWSLLAFFLVIRGLILKQEATESVIMFLDVLAGKNRRVEINFGHSLIATVLLTTQCARRFYETNFKQIFSKGKINLSHYIVGYTHYFGAITALLSNTEGFVRGTSPSSFELSQFSYFQRFCVLLFVFAWIFQFKSNLILVKIRKDPNTGKILTERHFLPRGQFFELISSPHMFFEIMMYICLWGIMKNTTWLCIAIWVLSNQIMNGLLTHQWYKENFKDYPKRRFAIIPFLL